MHFHENFPNFHGEIEDFAESSACDLSYCSSYKNYDFLNYNGEFLLPSSSHNLDHSSSPGSNKMHLDPLISIDPTFVNVHHSNPHFTHHHNPPSTMMVTASPISGSPGPLSPPSTANTQVETRIFQFPPQPTLVKQEDSSWTTLQEPGAGFSTIPVSSSSPAQCSPMAISPSISTLNTPRGSITSMRSQQSPMDQQHAQALADPMMSSYEAFDMAATAFVSYTTVSHQQTLHNLPSPPGSPVVTSTTSGFGTPYEYDEKDYYQHQNKGYPFSTTTTSASGNGSVPANPNSHHHPRHQEDSSSGGVMFDSGMMTVTKTEVESPHPVFPNHCSVMTNYGSTPDPSESFNISSDVEGSTCPETPDSSVKEEADVNSPDTGSYVCLWQDCHEEFVTQKVLVEHITESHMESKKGCEEFPCLWKDCSRKSKAFNAKYKLITHMRVHTKEKPYLCQQPDCNRAFARSENRKIHMRSHSGEKPFACKYSQEFHCMKKFSNSSDRAKHEQTHKDPKPYKCEVLGCTKRYTDPSSLRKHVKSHSVEEQQQYRRSKDLANMAKRSCSPTARYSSWTPSSSSSATTVASSTPAAELHNAINHATSTGLPPNMDDSQHQQFLQLTSSSTLLQSGGTLLTLDDLTASSSGAAGIPSPMQQHTGQQQKSAENSQSQGNESFHHRNHHHQGLAHQPNSLDDLDNDTIPFDNVPVRYDDSGLYEINPQQWPSNDPSRM